MIVILQIYMTKNEWSLAAVTDREINKDIQAIQEKHHAQDDFDRVLIHKENLVKERTLHPQQLLRVLTCKGKKREEEQSSLCSCCFQSIGSHKYWCKICGGSTCRKCLIRERELKDETKAFFCDKCDQEYLQAMNGILHFNRTERLEKALSRLIQQQQSLEKLVLLERAKQTVNGEERSQLACNGATIQKLTEDNKALKTRCSELDKKVEFGKNISRDLRRKLKGLKKEQGQSFGTVSNNESEDLLQERDELNLSVDHRGSILTVATNEEEVGLRQKCKCDIY